MESYFLIEDNLEAKLVTDDFTVRNLLAKALTFEVPGYQFSKAHTERGWDGKICLLNRNANTFSGGLVGHCQKYLESKGKTVPLVDRRDGSKRITATPEEIEHCLADKTLRDYQVKAIGRMCRATRGILQAATGSGKTSMAAGFIKIASKKGLKTLFLTHKTELLHQTAGSFIKSGIDAGMIGDSIREWGHTATIATVQTLYAGLKKGEPQIMALLRGIDTLIVDEAHLGDSKSFQAVCNACSNAYYRVGLTATPLMKTTMEDLALMSVTGPVFCRVTIKDLVERGLLAQPYIKFVKVTAPILSKGLPYPRAYKLGIVENERRHQMIVDEALFFAEQKISTLILVSKIIHGKTLLGRLSDGFPGLKVKYIHGSKDTETRNKALAQLGAGDLDVLISSTITDEGVDVPSIGAVILAGGLKSPIKLYQRIGRGMRPKDGFNAVLIVDFIDLTNRHLAAHSRDRYMTIKEEPGFEVVDDFQTILKLAA